MPFAAALPQAQDRSTPPEGFGCVPAGSLSYASHALPCGERLLMGWVAFQGVLPQLTCLRVVTGADEELDQVLGEALCGEEGVRNCLRELFGFG